MCSRGVSDELPRHKRKSSCAVLRRSVVGAFSFAVLHNNRHIKVDEDEIVSAVSYVVHDVVDADVAVQDLCLVAQVIQTCRGEMVNETNSNRANNLQSSI